MDGAAYYNVSYDSVRYNPVSTNSAIDTGKYVPGHNDLVVDRIGDATYRLRLINLLDNHFIYDVPSFDVTFRSGGSSRTVKFKNDSAIATFDAISAVSNIEVIISAGIRTVAHFDMDIAKGNHKLKKTNRLLYAPSLPYIKHYWQVMTLRRKFMGKNKLFEAPREGEDYVYMPLHLIPESTVFVKASYYVDELSLIEAVSKSLPVGWWLYVKEHQAMLGERSVEFYKRVRQLHNVRLVQVNHYHDPKPWIMNAKGVVTIVGTTAYEEALLGRKSILFGDVPFELIDGITKVHSYEELPGLIREFGEIDNIHSCAAYLKTIRDVGFEIDLFYLMAKAEKILAHEEERDEKFISQIDELMRFYEAGYARWIEEHDR